MDELSDNIIDRETALANFDHARDDFVRAYAQVPEKAMPYKPEGDDYSIGDLLPHVLNQINMYTVVLDTMAGVDWGADEGGGARPFEGESGKLMGEFAAQMQAIYAGGEGRDAITQELEQAHDRLASRLREMANKEYSRKAPVHYLSSEAPYLTGAGDLLAWLTDHYNEHIAQVWQLLEAWEKEK